MQVCLPCWPGQLQLRWLPAAPAAAPPPLWVPPVGTLPTGPVSPSAPTAGKLSKAWLRVYIVRAGRLLGMLHCKPVEQ